jgi:hypothetical protein
MHKGLFYTSSPSGLVTLPLSFVVCAKDANDSTHAVSSVILVFILFRVLVDRLKSSLFTYFFNLT